MKLKMKKRALLATATFIEKNPGEYNQYNYLDCLIALALKRLGFSVAEISSMDMNEEAEALGMTWQQHDRVYFITEWRKPNERAFRASSLLERKAQVAAAYLRSFVKHEGNFKLMVGSVPKAERKKR